MFADGSGKVVSKPLWSGFHDAGVHDLNTEAAIVLRGGKTGTAVTADVIILQLTMETRQRPDLQPLRPPVNFARNVETLTPTAVRHVRFTVETTNNGSEPCLDELELWTAGNDSRNVAGDAKLMSSGDYLETPNTSSSTSMMENTETSTAGFPIPRAMDGFSLNFLNPLKSNASNGDAIATNAIRTACLQNIVLKAHSTLDSGVC